MCSQRQDSSGQPVESGNRSTPSLEPWNIDLHDYLDLLHAGQCLWRGVVGGAVTAVAGAIAWGLVCLATRHQVAWMSISVGLIVGLAVRRYGNGIRTRFGIVGALLALMGCLLGNSVSHAVMAALVQQHSVADALLDLVLHPALSAAFLVQAFTKSDFVYLGIALWEGYRFSFRKVTDEELFGLLRCSR